MSKYNRSIHFSCSPGATNDDKISHDSAALENIDIIITEKLDGSNTCLIRGGVYARSHAEYTRNPWDRNMAEIHNRVGFAIDEDMWIFGENMYAIHSIEYAELHHTFYVFGIRVGDEWISWDDVCENAYLLDLPIVPVLWEGNTPHIEPLIKSLVAQQSRLGGFDIHTKIPQMEGCVARRRSAFKDADFEKSLLKYVRAGHVQSEEHWQKNWKKATIIYQSNEHSR